MANQTGSATGSRSAFISHSSADAAMAQQLCELMESRGVRCWLAPRNLDPGSPYGDEIVRGVASCDSLVLLATSTAIASANVLNEVEQAHKRHKTLLTVMIGHPGVTAQLDYYISRLHWIESQNGTMNDVASRLADVLMGHRSWPDVAAAPSLSRRLTYDRRALYSSILAAFVVAATVLTGIWFYLGHRQHEVATDYRSLGWITFDPEATPVDSSDEKRQLRMHLWLGDENTPTQAVRLTTSEENSNVRSSQDLTSQLPQNSAGVISFSYEITPLSKQFTTCLGVPSVTLHRRYTIMQRFNVVRRDGSLAVDQIGAPEVRPAGESDIKKECS